MAGLRVLDLTRALAGPYCTMILADLGADVIKVESFEGDITRLQGPFHSEDRAHHFGGYFQSVNRGKRSLAINLHTPQGSQVVKLLAAKADILVENFRPGVMESLGLGFDELHRAINPRLVYGCVRGFGDPRTGQSPYASLPAFDIVAQAMGGIMSITGPEGGGPVKVGPGVGDIFPATLLAAGILAAVLQARATGTGQLVDVAMYDAMVALCERMIYQYSYTGQVPRAVGNSNPQLCPFDVFRAADGWIAIAAPKDSQWRDLCSAMGRDELRSDRRYATNSERVANGGAVREIVGAWTSKRSVTAVVAALNGVVPCGPVHTAAEIFDDPHLHAREMLLSLEHPGSERPGIVAGAPIKFTEHPSRPSRRAPLLGEHTLDVLAEIGMTKHAVSGLIEDGVVQCSVTGDGRE